MRGSVESLWDGNTYCQAHSCGALGYLRASASGSSTSPCPTARSRSCSALTCARWCFSGSIADSRQHRDAVLAALAVADQDLPVAEVDVLDAQPQALEQPQAGAVQQARHQPARAVQIREQPAHFRVR